MLKIFTQIYHLPGLNNQIIKSLPLCFFQSMQYIQTTGILIYTLHPHKQYDLYNGIPIAAKHYKMMKTLMSIKDLKLRNNYKFNNNNNKQTPFTDYTINSLGGANKFIFFSFILHNAGEKNSSMHI